MCYYASKSASFVIGPRLSGSVMVIGTPLSFMPLSGVDSVGRLYLLSRLTACLSTDHLVIKDHIIGFYSNLFSSTSSQVKQDLSMADDVIPSMVTATENDFFHWYSLCTRYS